MRVLGQWLAVNALFVAVNALAAGLLFGAIWVLRALDFEESWVMPFVFVAVIGATLWVCKTLIEWPSRSRVRALEKARRAATTSPD